MTYSKEASKSGALPNNCLPSTFPFDELVWDGRSFGVLRWMMLKEFISRILIFSLIVCSYNRLGWHWTVNDQDIKRSAIKEGCMLNVKLAVMDQCNHGSVLWAGILMNTCELLATNGNIDNEVVFTNETIYCNYSH